MGSSTLKAFRESSELDELPDETTVADQLVESLPNASDIERIVDEFAETVETDVTARKG